MGKHGSDSKDKRKKIKVKSGVKGLLLSLFLAVLLVGGCGGEKEYETLDITKLSGEYLGEPFPFEEADVFLDGLTDLKHSIQNVMFSPDGNEFYFTRTTLDSDSATIMVSHYKNDYWTKPQRVSFSNEFNESDPFLTFDNKKLFFVSDRPAPGVSVENSYFDYNIWFVERTAAGWSKPQFLVDVNSEEDEYSPSLTKDGKIYFSSARTSSEGYWDVYEADFVDGKFSEARKSLYPVNTEYRDWDPYIFPDGEKILFVSDRPRGYGGGDIYLCVKNNEGRWEDPLNLETKINTNDYEYFPRISYDGRFLFFTRLLTSEEYFYQDKAPDTRDPFEYIYLPEGGRSLVYWMSVDSLTVLKF